MVRPFEAHRFSLGYLRAEQPQVPQNPNFLWGFGDPTNFMRLSLMRAAHGVLGGAAYRKFGSFAFFCKGRDTRHWWIAPFATKTRREGHPEICCVRKTSMVAPFHAPRVGEAGGRL
jgi:hypothetical protein